jgi:hypothetical protein
MPIEIRELHIKVAVNAAPPAAGGGAAAPAAGGAAGAGGGADEIVAECVEKVLQILNDRSER